MVENLEWHISGNYVPLLKEIERIITVEHLLWAIFLNGSYNFAKKFARSKFKQIVVVI